MSRQQADEKLRPRAAATTAFASLATGNKRLDQVWRGRGRRVKGSGSGHNLPLDCSISDLALYRVTNCGQVCANEQRRRRLQRRQRRRQHDH